MGMPLERAFVSFEPQPLASADEKLKSQGDWKAWKK